METDVSSMPIPAAVLFVANVPRMTQFYRDVAAMRLLHEARDHAILELQGFQLVIHAIRGEVGAQSVNDVQPDIRQDCHIKLCFPVESIDGARATAASLGGAIQPPGRVWEARGFRACDGNDPEGNVLQVRESAT
jgi:predicted enzyme related to lactoylglutathione lyase